MYELSLVYVSIYNPFIYIVSVHPHTTVVNVMKYENITHYIIHTSYMLA